MATPRASAPLRLHQRCELTSYGRGEVLFVGQAHFSPGMWVGIALDEHCGKNDGSVQGKRYFDTQAGYGVFVRPSQVHVLGGDEEEEEEEEEEDGNDVVPYDVDGEDGAEQQSSAVDSHDAALALGGVSGSSSADNLPVRRGVTTPASSAARPSLASSRTPARPPATSQRATPSVPSGRTSIAASSSRSISPAKRPSMARPPPSAARPGVMRPPTTTPAAARPQAVSPQKPEVTPSSATSSSRSSPFKTPARTPMARTSTAPGLSTRTPGAAISSGTSGRASMGPSPAPGMAMRTPRSASSAAASARAPATTQRTTTTAARQAVQASQAPDAATARAGLRPVAKQRMSMAPHTSATPRTPAVSRAGPPATTSKVTSATSVRRAPAAAAAAATAPRTTTNTGAGITHGSRAPRTTGTSSGSSARAQAAVEDDEGEDLMSMKLEDSVEVAEVGDGSMGEDNLDGPTSPSLRKASGERAATDHMSLSSGPSMATIARNSADTPALQRELEEARARLRISEKKRAEERERVREAEVMQQESEQFLAIKPRLIARQDELQNELKELHKQEREWMTQREDIERQLAELNDHVEILSLDKEFAEEKAEAATEELQALKDRVEEMELDLEVQREENARYEQGPTDDTDRSSVAFIQLEKQNERLKEALVRLRDLTAETDAEQKQRIAEQERELRSLDELQASYESVSSKLQTSEALLEDLKMQLDDALGAEEMLEQLTERNMSLTEKATEMRNAIEELEALKELNDELEETHLETEKQLQEEIDLKDMQLREHNMRNEMLSANLVDYEATFGQFRELVLNLQSENVALRDDEKARDASKIASSAEDQAMLNLNLKLQSSSIKSQAKTIELELGKLEAGQGIRQLDITGVYLPKEYFEQDKDAVESLLFFQRIAIKTEVVKSIVEGSSDVASSLVGVIEERLITICRMRHSLAHFIASARQIAALVQLASIPTFLKSGRMFKELTSVERRIDHFIDLLRREELKEDDCANEYRRFVKMLEDYEYALLDGSSEAPDSDLAAKELGSAILFDLDLDTIAAALGFSKQSVASLYNEYQKQTPRNPTAALGDTSMDSAAQSAAAAAAAAGTTSEIEMRMHDLDISNLLFEPLQDLINHLRSAKVPARKLVRRLSTLFSNEEAVKMDAIVRLPGLGKLSSELVTFATTIATAFTTYMANVRTNKAPFDLKEVLVLVNEATRESLDNSRASAGAGAETSAQAPQWTLALQETAHLNQIVAELLGAATEQDNVIKVSGAFPWAGRAEQMREEHNSNAEIQRVINKQTEDLRDLYKQIKARDEVIEENRIKIERLVKQLQRSRQDNEAVGGLRDDLVDVTKRMKAYEEGNSALQSELEQLQRQYEQALSEQGSLGRASRAIAGTDGSSSGTGAAAAGGGVGGADGSADGLALGAAAAQASGIMPSSNLEVSYLVDQLEALQGAVRFLRMENGMLKGRDLLAQVERLPTLVARRWSPPGPVDGMPAAADAPASSESEDATMQRGLPKSKKEGRFVGSGARNRPRQTIGEVRQQAESKRIVQDWIRLASNPRVVVLPPTAAAAATAAAAVTPGATATATATVKTTGDGEQPPPSEAPHKRRGWVPLAQLPQIQYRTQLQERARLRQRIDALVDHTGSGNISTAHSGSGHGGAGLDNVPGLLALPPLRS